MNKTYHILNGDALKDRFPSEFKGQIIVARECLVDGPVKAADLTDFYLLRAEYLSRHYGGTKEDYARMVAHEFEAVRNIPVGSIINLWFEDDLFCQVNFWFVAHLLHHFTKDCMVFLVRPKPHTPYSFAGLNDSELLEILEERLPLTELDKVSRLWTAYQQDATDDLINGAKELHESYHFILEAAEAHLDRNPTEKDPGRPVRSLMQVIKDLGTEEFGPVYKEFSKRESIYGFGDLQVKRLFERIRKD